MIREVGSLVTIQTTVRDSSGAAVNTPTVTVSVTAPDATTSTPTVTPAGAGGIYTASLTLSQAGIWRWTWTSSGTVVATQSDQLTAVAIGRALVASLDELKAQLNRSDTTDDTELRTYLAAATEAVEFYAGPVTGRTYTEVHCTRGSVIAPRRLPIISVTSITPYLGSTLAAGNYSVDSDAGVIRLRVSGWYEYTLVYVAGYSTLPESVKLAGLIIAQHLWQLENGGGGLPFPGAEPGIPVPGLGFAIPNRARDLLVSAPTAPGFA